MQFLPNWTRTHRKYSAQALAANAAVIAAWEAMPSDLKSALPASAPHVVAYLVLAISAFGILGSMIDQGAITESPTPPQTPQG